jgi:O-antigen/teichoic acid export membrane protein
MSQVVRNSTWLTAAHLAGYAIPLLELPILTRALGPEVYGGVVFALSLALALSLLVEFGFNLSASREIARVRDDPAAVARVVGNVLVAKTLLVIVIAGLCSIGFYFLGKPEPLARDLIVPTALFVLAFGFSPFWFFQGLERMVGPILLNLALRVMGLGLLWIFVRGEGDGAIALYLLAVVGLANTVITLVWMFRQTAFPVFSLAGGLQEVARGWHAFIYRSANDVLMSASPALLGMASGRYQTGVYVPAEKLVKAVAGMATPVLTAFFPFLSRRFSETGRISGWPVVFLLTGFSVVGALVLAFLAPWLIGLLAGEAFADSVDLLRLFVWLIPLRVMNQSLGLAVLMPLGRDRWAGYSLLASAVVAMTFGFFLSREFGAKGMVAGLLAGEALLAISLLFAAFRIIKGRS